MSKTLADHAEEWHQETTMQEPPPRDTPAWDKMYKRWHRYAFEDF